MIQIFRVFEHTLSAQKPFYTPDFRKTLDDWIHQPIFSGLVIENDKLLMLRGNENKVLLDNSVGAIVFRESIDGKLESVFVFPKNQRNFEIGFLTIRHSEGDHFELHVKSTVSHYLLEIPSPKRTAHKLANLDLQQPIRYRTNYKFECNGTKAAQRTFTEFDFILEYSARIKTIEYALKEPVIFDVSKLKAVDERKILK